MALYVVQTEPEQLTKFFCWVVFFNHSCTGESSFLTLLETWGGWGKAPSVTN